MDKYIKIDVPNKCVDCIISFIFLDKQGFTVCREDFIEASALTEEELLNLWGIKE